MFIVIIDAQMVRTFEKKKNNNNNNTKHFVFYSQLFRLTTETSPHIHYTLSSLLSFSNGTTTGRNVYNRLALTKRQILK